MREIDKNQSIRSTAKVAILAALNITDELFQERLYRQKLMEQLDEEAKRLHRELAEVLEE
jgi:cell division protein ZapA (FtsZ GTPase activity inhibitor)